MSFRYDDDTRGLLRGCRGVSVLFLFAERYCLLMKLLL